MWPNKYSVPRHLVQLKRLLNMKEGSDKQDGDKTKTGRSQTAYCEENCSDTIEEGFACNNSSVEGKG